MKLTIESRSLRRLALRAAAVAARKSPSPSLTCALLIAEHGTLRVLATDTVLSSVSTAAWLSGSAGSVAVNAKKLSEICKDLPDSTAQLSTDANGALTIKSGKFRFRLPGMPSADYPTLPSSTGLDFASVDAGALSLVLSLTQRSMSSDESRPHLASTILELDGATMRAVTTDGHRLSKAEARCESSTLQALIPVAGIREIRSLADEAAKAGEALSIAVQGSSAFFRACGTELSVKLSQEKPVPYSKIIPASSRYRAIVSRESLLSALRRAAIASGDGARGVQLVLEDGALTVIGESAESGEGADTVEAEYAGERIRVALSATYLADAIAPLTEESVAMELDGPDRPIIVRPVGSTQFCGLIMPRRL